jgi:hypothetical protein
MSTKKKLPREEKPKYSGFIRGAEKEVSPNL